MQGMPPKTSAPNQAPENLIQILSDIVDAPVECDGFARLAHSRLTSAGIDHRVMRGVLVSCDNPNRGISPHFWLELDSGLVIDYRARMWLGPHQEVPHGVFTPDAFSHWRYEGEEVLIGETPEWVLEILMINPRDYLDDQDSAHARKS
ncbi:MAG: hypothetical protein CMI09_00440 [Oceanospirillaceae bacterium]|jgi:hypothetical protein|nr:hypothetical protein [Oceanospirillaceae bacterium]|tara:strand:- start:1279 stop:1722 length:444 start_codon:yes stop_codon:yes gene_type:complete